MVGGLERTVTTSTQPASLPPRREIWEWRGGVSSLDQERSLDYSSGLEF